MFGISWAEFFVIFLVAVLVIPGRMWPDVARFVARLIKTVRGLIWKITDASENIKQQIELEKPIDELLATTTNDVLADFSEVLPKRQLKKTTKKTSKPRAKK